MIDPLLAHIPTRIDGYSDQHVRTAIAPLARLAEDLDVAVIAITHLNKREAGDLFARVGGSGGFLAAARSALLVAPDPDDEEQRIVAHGKSNIGPLASSLRFRLGGCELANPDPDDPEPIRVASVAMIGDADVSVEMLLNKSASGAKGEATAWLAKTLANGPQPAERIEKAAQEAGHSVATLKRAKKDLGVRSDRVGGLGKEGRWEWSF